MTDPERWLDDPSLPKQLRNALTERVRATDLPQAVRRRVGVRLAVTTGAVLGGSLLAGQAAAANTLTAASGAGAGVGKVAAAKLAIAAKLQGLGGAVGWVTSSVVVGAIGAAVLVDQVTTEAPSPSEMSIHVQAPEKTITHSKRADASQPQLAAATVPSEATTATQEPPPDGRKPPSRDVRGERALSGPRPLPVQDSRPSPVQEAWDPEKEVEPSAASAAAPRDDALGREVDELRAASRALGVSPQEALELVQRHRQEFPRSQLATERRVLELRALLALGQTASAQRVGRALLEDRGAALYHQRVRRLLAAKGESAPEATP